jgi:AraC-like DNA-binding protein
MRIFVCFVRKSNLKLYIKYMVSNRCKMAVKAELKKFGLHFFIANLGEVDLLEDISEAQRLQLKAALSNLGFELMEDKKGKMIEAIKNTIHEMVYQTGEMPKLKFSEYLSRKLNHSYTDLASLFSEMQGTTIEQYFIGYKIQRVKELIVSDGLSITEVAWRMNYSSVAHLSNQFKKVTGLSLTHFKQLKNKRQEMTG